MLDRFAYTGYDGDGYSTRGAIVLQGQAPVQLVWWECRHIDQFGGCLLVIHGVGLSKEMIQHRTWNDIGLLPKQL